MSVTSALVGLGLVTMLSSIWVAVMAGLPEGDFAQTITGGEMAVMLQNALDLAVESAAGEDIGFASIALTTLQQNGFPLTADTLLRSQAAESLYLTSQLTSQGLGVFLE